MNVISLEDYKRKKAEKFQQEWLRDFNEAMEYIRKQNDKCTGKIAPIVFMRPPIDVA